ncbi:MAG: MFS transporter [Arcobacter sp.]|nr:MAG: MFS transporter [Arcobacter sp.]
MQNITLNKNSNLLIILAGIASLIIGMGVARFAFTALLPFMLEEHLSVKLAGFLASTNYIGYFLGCVFAIFVKDIYIKVYLLRAGLIVSIVSTLVLGLSTNETLWIISRFVAGLGTAMCVVVGSSLVMLKLDMENKTKVMGIYFSGIGFSIFITDLLIKSININENLWQISWIILVFFAFFLIYLPWSIISFDKKVKYKKTKISFDITLFTPFVLIVMVAYFCEGMGFVVQATFLPDIINNLEGLEGYGGLTWLFVGLAGIPSSIIWMRLAHNHGSVNMIILALLLQVIGILIPVFSNNIALNILSGVLYGSTFIGLVALFMNLGGKLSSKNPVVLMGAITSAYSIGMILAPLYCVYFYEKYTSYDYALYVTAFIVLMAVCLLTLAKKLDMVKE